MKSLSIKFLRYFFSYLFFFIVFQVHAIQFYSKAEVLKTIQKVNNQWQLSHSEPGKATWDEAVYQTGNMAAYFVTKNSKFRKYSENWAIHNNWKGATSDDKTKWKSNYGETPDYVLFGDWQVCFQTYIDLFNLSPDSFKIARAREVMEYEMSTPRNDYWWWADGLYMVMPVMTKLYRVTGNTLYLDKLYEYFEYAKSIMYDPETGLFYRDAKYVYPKHKTSSEKKDFWARGNGWVFAGLAKVLTDMPKNYIHRDVFVNHYLKIANELLLSQQKEGYWTRSLLDPKQAPGYETSGTAFFTFGYLWGLNNGLLKGKRYENAALKGWHYLSKIALQPDGSIGYVQPIGEKAIPGQIVDKHSTANFGVGAFLLAASEMTKFTNKIESKK